MFSLCWLFLLPWRSFWVRCDSLKNIRGWDYSSVLEGLPYMRKALSSIPSTARKQKQRHWILGKRRQWYQRDRKQSELILQFPNLLSEWVSRLWHKGRLHWFPRFEELRLRIWGTKAARIHKAGDQRGKSSLRKNSRSVHRMTLEYSDKLSSVHAHKETTRDWGKNIQWLKFQSSDVIQN
jgi:hypothetical protein